MVTRRGSKVALIGVGDYYKRAEEVAALLEKEGISPTIINPRFVSGVDTELLNSLAANHGVVATIEDGSLGGGFGQRVASAVCASALKCLNFGLAKQFENQYKVKELEEKNGLLPQQIANAILSVIGGK